MIKIAFDVPKKMMNKALDADISSRPYDLCLECPFISETCDGPNCLAMTEDRWVKWATARLSALRMTREKLAAISGIPLGTINSIFQGKTQDMRHSTMRELTKVLVGGCWGQYPCHFAALMIKGTVLEDDRRTYELEAELKRECRDKRADIRQIREDYQSRVELLKMELEYREKQLQQKSRTINIMRFVFAIIIFALFAVLLFDKLNPNIGWLRDMAGLLEAPTWNM